MKNAMIALVLAICPLACAGQGAPPQGGANQPYIMEYYFVNWVGSYTRSMT